MFVHYELQNCVCLQILEENLKVLKSIVRPDMFLCPQNRLSLRAKFAGLPSFQWCMMIMSFGKGAHPM